MILNPYFLLAVVLAIVGSFGGGYWKGSKDEVTRQQLEIAALNAAARQKEQALVAAVTTQATKLQKANQDAKLIAKERDAAIASGALKLRIPVKPPSAPYKPPEIPPLPPEIAFKQEPNLTQRLLNLLSPLPTTETKPSDSSTPASTHTTPSTKP